MSSLLHASLHAPPDRIKLLCRNLKGEAAAGRPPLYLLLPPAYRDDKLHLFIRRDLQHPEGEGDLYDLLNRRTLHTLHSGPPPIAVPLSLHGFNLARLRYPDLNTLYMGAYDIDEY